MDDQTPPLATYPGPKKQRSPSGMSPGVQRGLFLLGGVAIGAFIVVATLKFASKPPDRVVYTGPAGQTTPNQAVKTAPTLTNPPVTKDPAKPAPDGATPEGPTANLPPFNPFEGSLGGPMPGREITGHIDRGTPPPRTSATQPSAQTTPPEAAPTPKGLLVTMRLNVGDPDSALSALRSVAAKNGGSAIQFDEIAAKADPEGAILFIPAAKAEEAEKQIASIGSIVVRDKWNGNSADRLDRIERPAEDRLSDLHIKRQELLVKYFEDAPEVKHIDEDSERIRKCMSALRGNKPGPNVAVFKIKFLT